MDLRDITEFLRDCIGYIISLIVVILFFTFIIAFHPVAGNSMVPTLEEGSITVVSKSHHLLFKLRRNQIVIIKKEKKTYIKRIIGLPGEEIHYLNNTLYVNGKQMSESFLDKNINTNSFMFDDICSKEQCSNNVIPNDYYFVLGDNREDSLDSRNQQFGLVKKEEIKGVVIFNIWPIENIKKL